MRVCPAAGAGRHRREDVRALDGPAGGAVEDALEEGVVEVGPTEPGHRGPSAHLAEHRPIAAPAEVRQQGRERLARALAREEHEPAAALDVARERRALPAGEACRADEGYGVEPLEGLRRQPGFRDDRDGEPPLLP
jgi:hypothetical protein